MKEFWALRLPDGEFWDNEGSIMTFDTEAEAVEYSEGFAPLDYAVAVKFVQVAR